MIRTAGMVKWTPDWQLDRMYETETAEALERYMNSDDDFPRSNIASQISTADYHLGQAIDFLCRASKMADGYGRAGAIDDLINLLENFRCDVNACRRKLEGKQ